MWRATPTPVSATLCGLPVAESVKMSVSVLVPALVGAKVKLTVQESPFATEPPQVFVPMAYCVPVAKAMLEKVTVAPL